MRASPYIFRKSLGQLKRPGFRGGSNTGECSHEEVPEVFEVLQVVRRIEVVRVLARAKIYRAGHGVETHGMQIRHLHLPAQALQVLNRVVHHRSDEGLRFVVSVDDGQFHGRDHDGCSEPEQLAR